MDPSVYEGTGMSIPAGHPTDLRSILPQLEAFIAYRKANPLPVRIWFIDRLALYHTLYNLFLEDDTLPSPSYGLLRGVSLPLLFFTSDDLQVQIEIKRAEGWTEERLQRFFPCRDPGAWIELSNGRIIELVDTDAPLHAGDDERST